MYIEIDEFCSGLQTRNKAYSAIESYLSSITAARKNVSSTLKVDWFGKRRPMVFKSATSEIIPDEFEGVKVEWRLRTRPVEKKMIFLKSATGEERRYYTVAFHPKHWDVVKDNYLTYVFQQGKAIQKKTRQRYINMNKSGTWEFARLDHPASFDSFAMDPNRKLEIIKDLIAFKEGKEHYSKIGKAWKRGYLLYGPPGTGKSTMILAMSNLLDYDIYDLELATVVDNSMLKSLLIDIPRKAIVVIEDIDCSLDITEKRKTQREEDEDETDSDHDDDEGRGKSMVTLSGLLNFVDGIWSAIGSEKVIVFTTNHVDKLDPALIRRGRMDMHIELSYCTFQGFKVLAKNYLDIDSHPLFETIGGLLDKVDTTPVDVIEHLIHYRDVEDVKPCLESLIRTLETAKEAKEEEAITKAKEEEAVTKAKEEEAMTKAQGKKYNRSVLKRFLTAKK
ncbi:hypothetical protein CCACVL1_22776 [Corchorus capsularis]|uniref:AAA+ ATPase domain-containing protein n=1 Tax=Corchorus capsularis TaxID=210143 RepID=A0A1R3GWR9_COCAP|nr:hypothetical protein CCACVL1_22776 [Corchorus capsularis]